MSTFANSEVPDEMPPLVKCTWTEKGCYIEDLTGVLMF